MIAQQEVKHQPRGGAPTAASNNTASRKSQATSSGTPHTANGAQSAKGASAAGTDAVKSARTPEMVRDRVISKFSKKKPAYSSCRMLSQVSTVVSWASMPPAFIERDAMSCMKKNLTHRMWVLIECGYVATGWRISGCL